MANLKEPVLERSGLSLLMQLIEPLFHADALVQPENIILGCNLVAEIASLKQSILNLSLTFEQKFIKSVWFLENCEFIVLISLKHFDEIKLEFMGQRVAPILTLSLGGKSLKQLK